MSSITRKSTWAHIYQFCKGFCSSYHNIEQVHEISMPTHAIEYSNFKGEYEAKLEFPQQRDGLNLACSRLSLSGVIKKGLGQQPEKERKGKGGQQASLKQKPFHGRDKIK